MYGRKRRRGTIRKRYGRRAKTYVKRKGNYRRRSYKKAVALRSKWINPMAIGNKFKFVFADSNFSRTLNAAGSYSAYYVFRGNSPYDPDYTGVGVQPYGWDEVMSNTMNQSFRTPSSSIKVYFRVEEAYANIRRLHVAVIPMRVANPVLTDISDARMIPFYKETCYDGAQETTRGAQIKHYCSTKRLDPAYSSNDIDWAGLNTGNPTNQWYWIVLFYTDVYDDEEVDVYFDVKIKYYTMVQRWQVPNES